MACVYHEKMRIRLLKNGESHIQAGIPNLKQVVADAVNPIAKLHIPLAFGWDQPKVSLTIG